MTVDVKKLLYKYRKLEVGLANIQTSLQRLNKKYPGCTPRYSDEIQGRGGLPHSQTEAYAFYNVVDIEEKREQLQGDASDYQEALNLVITAMSTLNPRQQDLIRFRYFDDREPMDVARMLSVSIDHFYTLHRIAMDGIEDCMNGGNIVISNNRLVPMKKTKKNHGKYNRNTTVTVEKAVV